MTGSDTTRTPAAACATCDGEPTPTGPEEGVDPFGALDLDLEAR